LIALYRRVDWPWCWFGWVVLVPWLATLDRAASLRAALANALAMNLIFVLVFFTWFTHTIHIYTGASPAIAFGVLLLAAPLLEPQFFVFAAARHLARRPTAVPRFWYVTFTGACAYVGAEWALGKLFGVTFGYGLYGSRLMRQAADLIGGQGLTLVLLIGNECLLAVARALVRRVPARERLRRAARPAACTAALVLALYGYGWMRCRQLDALAARAVPVDIAAIQANISHYDRLKEELGTYEAVRQILDAHFQMSSDAIARWDPDLLVWPETVYPTTFGSPQSADGAAFDREIARFAAFTGRPLIFGSYDAEAGKQYNAAVFLEADTAGKVAYDAYRKASLFPLTERVPAFLDVPIVRRWFPWMGTWTRGAPPAPVVVTLADGRRLRVVPLICYDALDPDVTLAAARQGADLIVTLSNDSWFAAGIAPRLHQLMASFRSIETHLPQLRATNTGISGAMSAAGDLLATTALNERTTLFASLAPMEHTPTLLARWGNWVPRVALIVAVVLLAAPWAAGRRVSPKRR
jgi:apolipoprotein N-acyltransferase